MSMASDTEEAVGPGQGLVLSDTLITGVAGYYYHAAAPVIPGEPVYLIREPANAADANAVAICDVHGQRIGYLPRRIAAEFAGLIDHGCLRLFGRLLASGESG